MSLRSFLYGTVAKYSQSAIPESGGGRVEVHGDRQSHPGGQGQVWEMQMFGAGGETVNARARVQVER